MRIRTGCRRRTVLSEPSHIISTYCLQCRAGQEGKLTRHFEAMGYAVLAPYAVRGVWRREAHRRERRRLLPGYLFLTGEKAPERGEIGRLAGAIRVLQYEDGEKALRGDDLAFVAWLRQNDGVIDVSRAYQEGTHIRIVDGPLRYYAGSIVKVDKKRKSVAVKVGVPGEEKLVWCSIELIEPE